MWGGQSSSGWRLSEGESLSTVPGPRLTADFSLKPHIHLKVSLYPLGPHNDQVDSRPLEATEEINKIRKYSFTIAGS
jgi:hypothetical protein